MMKYDPVGRSFFALLSHKRMRERGSGADELLRSVRKQVLFLEQKRGGK